MTGDEFLLVEEGLLGVVYPESCVAGATRPVGDDARDVGLCLLLCLAAALRVGLPLRHFGGADVVAERRAWLELERGGWERVAELYEEMGNTDGSQRARERADRMNEIVAQFGGEPRVQGPARLLCQLHEWVRLGLRPHDLPQGPLVVSVAEASLGSVSLEARLIWGMADSTMVAGPIVIEVSEFGRG